MCFSCIQNWVLFVDIIGVTIVVYFTCCRILDRRTSPVFQIDAVMSPLIAPNDHNIVYYLCDFSLR